MFLFIVLFFVLMLLMLSTDRIRAFFMAWSMKGPFAYPLIGNGYLAFDQKPEENFQLVYEFSEKYGSIFRIWAGPQLIIILNDPKYTETILSSQRHIAKSYEYKMLSSWLKDGLLLSKGKKWLQRRKILTPAFHFSILEEYVECFDEQSSILANKLRKFKPNEKVDLYPMITLCALDVICETTMGTSINAQSENSEYAKAVRDVANSMINRFYDVFMRSDIFWNLSQRSREQRNILKVLHQFTENVIRKRRQKLNMANNNSIESVNDVGIKQKRAFIDILLNATIDGKPLTDQEIREEVDTFMFEGHDTTTSCIFFALYNIAKEPNVQKKCFEEIRQVFGDDKSTRPQMKDLNDLNYLDLVIKETLRLYPSVPLIGRHVSEDVELYDGTVIPRETDVVINIFNTGRNSKFYPDPEKFLPERFSRDDSDDKLSNFMFTPFSAGPRNCIGQKFAVLEIKSAISKLLRNFEISLAEETLNSPLILSAELILISKNPLYFQFQPRTYA